ncbi:MAG: hypothetical protein IJT41_04730 [Clostridia bacterium]|nr:hypothetical protein [Clostridia bacterium]
MKNNPDKRQERMTEWLHKVLRGAGGGLILSIVMTITGAFKGDPVWMYFLCYAAYMLYGIGFSFGILITKLAWRKFVARGRTIGVWAAVTGNGLFGLILAIAVLLCGLTVSCLLGFVICIADLVAAIQGKRLLSAILEMRYGDRQYEPADPGSVIEAGVRYNYEDHGTADAGATDYTRKRTPTQDQVDAATKEKKHELGYWN